MKNLAEGSYATLGFEGVVCAVCRAWRTTVATARPVNMNPFFLTGRLTFCANFTDRIL